ncbi:hypothetical protein D0466_18730 [Peribacillus glennii]|uniref:Uncharacterized protein n=1 Tax=Peribacillus glennii TaxID=2303991 RepID=A0A372L7M5_9BACI|nr:hypothetical protein D0466_18730 [Peribacillus glennii]
MQIYRLKKDYKDHKKGAKFLLISHSEFIGVKEFVLQTQDLKQKVLVSDQELKSHFVFLNEKKSFVQEL